MLINIINETMTALEKQLMLKVSCKPTTETAAITIFLQQPVSPQGIPFQIKKSKQKSFNLL